MKILKAQIRTSFCNSDIIHIMNTHSSAIFSRYRCLEKKEDILTFYRNKRKSSFDKITLELSKSNIADKCDLFLSIEIDEDKFKLWRILMVFQTIILTLIMWALNGGIGILIGGVFFIPTCIIVLAINQSKIKNVDFSEAYYISKLIKGEIVNKEVIQT